MNCNQIVTDFYRFVNEEIQKSQNGIIFNICNYFMKNMI